MRRILITLFSTFLAISSFAQEYSLKIYTKENCDRCSSSLSILDKNSIIYENCVINEELCQTQMWVDLAKVGELKVAMVPVISLNGQVVYPVYKNGKIQEVDRIVFIEQLVQDLNNKNLAINNNKQLNSLDSNKYSVNNLCNGRFYVICGSFTKQVNAEKFLISLKEEGYLNAQILTKNNYKRVSISNFSKFKDAKKVQFTIKNRFKDSWIYTSK